MPVETTFTRAMRFPAGRAAPVAISFDYRNPYAQVEVVGTAGWLELLGTHLRREPYIRLVWHQDEEIFVADQESTVEEFGYNDPYAQEIEHLARTVTGRARPLSFGLEDARAETAALQAMHASLSETPGPGRG